MIPLILFVLGANIGSFLNVCIWRMPRHESVAHPPSHCPMCNTRLRGIDLVPLISQLYLGGKCRYCGAKFSWRYFGIELLTAILFLLVALQPGNGGIDGFFAPWTGDIARLSRDLIFVSTLVVVFFVDYDTRLIQLESVLLMGLSGVAFDAWHISQGARLEDGALFAAMLPASLPASLLSMVVCATGLFVVREGFSRLYKKEALGFGDVLLVAAIAANLGWNATLLTFFFLAATVGALIGVSVQIPRAIRSYRWGKNRAQRYGGRKISGILARRAFRKVMPFGPMLAIGAVAALLYGAQINAAYLRLLMPETSMFGAR
ncbi:leader peptidase (prepilin peptidase) / N-methyltransferase [Abditibacterium utsteinense]|uniref:Leader peptidase (Prepilin peptidase) / N-methyltransferase n=1 Tax=Abditibacterium utsteinense TaxID=1960156 RepID=A0A2S8SVW4_9BACT|nr:A24 family peptidase [Abditibacterium utsteinense]PQV64927.1 leader peptidase (prepilin peptidase) / N-methyltransferase [Abditibacterium utsteinense]